MSNFLFDTQNADGSTSLYATDGTAAGTVDLDMARFGTFTLAGSPDFTLLDGKMYFIGNVPNGPDTYSELFGTDGTAAGTVVLPAGLPNHYSTANGLWSVGDHLVVSGIGKTGDSGLYVNGVPLESGRYVANENAMLVSHGLGLFGATASQDASTSLWRTDGTAAGTYSITPAGVALNPLGFTSVANGNTVFSNLGTDGSTTLWVTNGTAAGTHRVASAPLGTQVRLPGATANGRAIFTAVDAANNISVWASDGTTSGTVELAISGPKFAAIRTSYGFTPFGNDVVYNTGYGLVVTDGTVKGTVQLPDTQALQSSVVLGNKIVFTAFNVGTQQAGDGSLALFVSDGTAAGTHQIALPYGLDVDQSALVVTGGQVVFSAVNAAGHEAMYATDGTVAGTTALAVPSATLNSTSEALIALPTPPADPGTTDIVLTAGQSYTNTAAGDFAIQATGATIDMVAGNSTISGSGNVIMLGSGSTQVNDATTGAGNTIAGGAGGLVVTGGNATVFGGAGSLDYSGGGGIQVLGAGDATVAGGAAGTVSEVFGGTGHIDYAGQSEKGYVIGSVGSVSVSGGAGGGWYEGGTNGDNVITAAGIGSVLDAGGNGDRLTGDSSGWDYFLASSGSVTLTGGNSSGSQFYFGGAGNATENLGSGTSTIVAGTGAEDIFGGTNDTATVWLAAASGHVLINAGTGGETTVVGFRAGIDHLHAAAVTAQGYAGGNISFTLSSGEHITLIGVDVGTGVAFI